MTATLRAWVTPAIVGILVIAVLAVAVVRWRAHQERISQLEAQVKTLNATIALLQTERSVYDSLAQDFGNTVEDIVDSAASSSSDEVGIFELHRLVETQQTFGNRIAKENSKVISMLGSYGNESWSGAVTGAIRSLATTIDHASFLAGRAQRALNSDDPYAVQAFFSSQVTEESSGQNIGDLMLKEKHQTTAVSSTLQAAIGKESSDLAPLQNQLAQSRDVNPPQAIFAP